MLQALISTESEIEARITYSRVCSKINMYIEHCVSDERAGERDVMDREAPMCWHGGWLCDRTRRRNEAWHARQRDAWVAPVMNTSFAGSAS